MDGGAWAFLGVMLCLVAFIAFFVVPVILDIEKSFRDIEEIQRKGREADEKHFERLVQIRAGNHEEPR